jgi:hypothetical protein
MHRLIMLAGTAALAFPLWAQEAPAPKPDVTPTPFSSADANKDGVLTLDEMKTHRREHMDALRKTGDADDPAKSLEDMRTKYDGMLSFDEFLRYDTDDDGRLSQDEYDKLAGGDLPEFTDKDAELYGDMTYDEWSRFANARGDDFKIADFNDRMVAARRVQRVRAGDDLGKRYAMTRANSSLRDYHALLVADANDDGIVSRAESRAYWQRNYSGKIDADLNTADSKLYNEARFGEWTSALDSNDDGVLTRDEVNNAYDAPNDEAWKKLDANSDDKLDRDEIGGWDVPDTASRRAAEQPKREDKAPDGEGETPKAPKAPGTPNT